jgi:hypothetical protein
MTFRAHLSLFALETRENPSVPGLDPYVVGGPAPTDPTAAAPGTDNTTDATALAQAAVIAGVTQAPATPAPAAPVAQPVDTTNLLYLTP